MRAADLEPGDRSALRQGRVEVARSRSPLTAPTRTSAGPGRFRCCSCDVPPFRSVAGVERHIDTEHGGGRYEVACT